MKKIKLVEICNPKQWKTIPTGDLLDEGYPVYGANGIIGYYDEYNHENPVVVITCRGATCGSINITVPQAYVTGNAMCLDDVRDDIEIEYLYYCLKHYDFNGVISGSAQPQITRQGLNKVGVSICSHEEQLEIIDKLKIVETIIKLREKELLELDNLIKARFVEMFGMDVSDGVPLRECCIDVRGGGTPSMKHPEYYGGVVPFIKSGDVKDDLVFSGALWLTEKALSETTAKYIPEGSVIVVTRSAALLKEFRAAVTGQPVVINQDIKAFIPKTTYTSQYLLWAIKIQSQYLLTKVTTVLTSHIDLKDLLELRIVPAPVEKQKAFSAFVKQIDKSKVVVQKALDEVRLLFDSLMQKYFG